ncbi:MAG: 3-dehydroquinate synthase family protein [Sphaerochaetaceae bacterium]
MEQLYNCVLDGRTTQVLRSTKLEEVFRSLDGLREKQIWVCDSNTRSMLPADCDHVLVLSPGESAKNWSSIEALLTLAMNSSIARDSRFIAFGGGVVCDMTAFAASIYMRGCRLTLIPTTLLAMVDASLGGKTAIDFLGVKNLVGTFYPADQVILCCETLVTLPAYEYRNGLGEVLKHAVLSKSNILYRFLAENRRAVQSRSPETLQEMITLSLDVKRSYIERDPKETMGIRDALNLGHTFAHALESIGHLKTWSHGEAVAWGVGRALEAGKQLGITPTGFADICQTLLDSYGFTDNYKVDDTEAFLEALSHDKKKREGGIRFVLMAGQGEPVLKTLGNETIQSLIS